MTTSKPLLANGSSTPMLCGHCGKRSVFQVRSEGTQRGETPFADSRVANSQGVDGQTITTWRVLECAICHQPTFVQEVVEYTYNDDYQGNPTIDAADTAVLYPTAATNKSPTAIPQREDKPDIDLSLLHPDIFNKCKLLFETGAYAEAAEKSFKVVRDQLRHLTGHETGSEAFGRGHLRVKGAAARHAEEDFNEAVKFLTMAIDRFRNEKAHTSDAKISETQRAFEYLCMSSLAMRLLEGAEGGTTDASQTQTSSR